MSEKYSQLFDSQLQTLLQKGYPKAANLSDIEFSSLVVPLKEKIQQLQLFELDIEKGKLPFVIVISRDLIANERAMSLVEREGKQGITKLFPHTSADFPPLSTVNLPKTKAYLLLNIDRGKASINVPPNEALREIVSQNRSPLTIDEGIAIVTQYPDFLIKNNCFSLLASRHTGDQRVPAIWINAQKQPNLGWCWDGNPHTWLGSASCSDRLG
jgi:hypothetical protein